MNTEMKMEYMLNAEESRILRKWQRNAHRKAKKSRANYPTWSERSKGYYHDRICLRKEQRYLHLARGFTSYKKYGQLEDETCRKPVDIEELELTLNLYGYFPETETLKEWVNA